MQFKSSMEWLEEDEGSTEDASACVIDMHASDRLACLSNFPCPTSGLRCWHFYCRRSIPRSLCMASFHDEIREISITECTRWIERALNEEASTDESPPQRAYMFPFICRHIRLFSCTTASLFHSTHRAPSSTRHASEYRFSTTDFSDCETVKFCYYYFFTKGCPSSFQRQTVTSGSRDVYGLSDIIQISMEIL